ncbi:hypothetical protein B9G69_009720 [Bdellovibrio sp. SKB1291214]|uniref:hypothetical protein n=1 Tax=Bdellovibrio sp. SKB1291214 TaxID=1732569 RepID=UPI000B5178F3|nr:hypothetical protein [Bdellovibrio sp. SKB1291214]UYL07323.1 hypothetical protein B9G69_009720 [Bdellovibrio sp. SKB1291214]
MKNILLGLVLSFSSLNAGAFTVESTYDQILTGQYVKTTKVSCQETTANYCTQICNNPVQCVRREPYCRNCAGTSSPLLRQLFTELSRLYAIQAPMLELSPLIHFLAHQNYVLLDLNSVFNYYTPVGGELFLNELRSFCADQADTALLVVKLDEVHQPASLNYVLCKNPMGQTAAFEVAPRTPGIQQQLKTEIFFNLN